MARVVAPKVLAAPEDLSPARARAKLRPKSRELARRPPYPMRITDCLPPADVASSVDPERVRTILADVRARGDVALTEWTRRFDRALPPAWSVPPEVCAQAWHDLAPADRAALEHAAANVRAFAEAQVRALVGFTLELDRGVAVGQRVVPVQRVACYVPGGRHPLPSTVLMTALPARAAGVPDVAVFTPPGADGWPHPAILAACHLCGVHRVHPVGGVHGIAAAAFGTDSIAPVDLIAGPGNAWVTEAKRQVFGLVGIDMLAGPSEVLVLCDATADPVAVAADLLAQAEHDPDAHALVLTDDAAMARRIAAEVDRQQALLPHPAVAAESLARHGCIAVLPSRAALLAAANERAPEHLELMVADPDSWIPHLHSHGALFVGRNAAEVLGDYCAGPSHVLPTGGSGRWQGGLGAHTFLKVLSVQRAGSGAAHGLAVTAVRLARLEGLEAHARAAEVRLGVPSSAAPSENA
ncbi:MAG: histidinol dehydrogenase [Myxococcales bacterium]|nr:histidinol dehydrogenase [Myxococcales bacterium]